MSNFKKKAIPHEADVKMLHGKLLAIGGDFEKALEITIDNIEGSTTMSGNLVSYTDEQVQLTLETSQEYTDSKKYLKNINIEVGNGDTVIASGTVGYSSPVTFSGIIVSWTISETSFEPVEGTVEVDIWKSDISNYPPTELDSITGILKPKLQNQYINQDTSLVDWNSEINIGDCIAFKITSNLNCRKIHLVLAIETGVN